MFRNFFPFLTRKLQTFCAIVFNITIFLPHFFSVNTLAKTLFLPWKQIVVTKTKRGFSLTDAIERLILNLFSRFIGFVMRLSILYFFLLVEVVFVLCLPFVFFLYLLYMPLEYVLSLLTESKDVIEKKNKEKFILTHLLDENNRSSVENWYEDIHRQKQYRWWDLPVLLSYPPLARDWAYGYTPTIDQFATELTSDAYQAKLTPLFYRDKEILLLEESLTKNHHPHVVIVGEPGVGKRAVIDALSKKIYVGSVNQKLAYKRILVLNLEKILSITQDQKEREEYLEELFEEALVSRNCIIVIDHIDRYISQAANRIDLSLIIEKYAKQENLSIIGLTSPKLYGEYLPPHSPLYHYFTEVLVKEITKSDAFSILLQKTPLLEKEHHLYLPYETIKEVIEKCEFYITSIPYPEKAIDLLQTACVYYQMTYHLNQKSEKILHPEIIDVVLTEKTQIPVVLNEEIKEKLRSLEEQIEHTILFQHKAIKEIASGIRRSFLILGKQKKPLATCLFLGPTGVGKTLTAQTLSSIFFQNKIHRFDMSEFQSEQDVPKLIGSLENGKTGLLTQSISQEPYGILLLDEIEKAHKTILHLFLTLLDEGYITDGFGNKIDGKNLMVIATSNAGANVITKNGLSEITKKDFVDYVIKNNLFTPEFLNRFDVITVFEPISYSSCIELAKKIIHKIKEEIYSLYHVMIEVDEDKIEKIAQKGFSKEFGARDLERTVRAEIENKIAEHLLEKNGKEGDIIHI